jgi:membrane protease YdiL (CAAX protease family)
MGTPRSGLVWFGLVWFGLVWFGVRRTTGLRGLIGGRWVNARQAITDFLLGFAFWGVWYVIERFVLTSSAQLIAQATTIFPQVWVLMAATSGFCEEFVFRGYFLKQFSAWTASVPIGVTLQAVLFGAAHPLLGAKQMIVIIVSGVLFGVLALWRNSLRPGMVAHAWADIFGGIILHGLPYK